MGRLITKTASGAIASFNGNKALPLESCKVNFLPVQSGTGDPSPSNVRPITGWNGVNVAHCGVNIWDEQWEHGIYNVSDGTKISTDITLKRIRSKNHFPCSPNTTYYRYSGINLAQVLFYDEKDVYISYINTNATNPFTTPPNCYYMALYTEAEVETYQNNISINYPSTDTTYHTYSSTQYPITFPAVGKNLLNPNSYGSKAYDNIVFGGEALSGADGSLILEAGTYTTSSSVTMSAIIVTYIDGSGTSKNLGVQQNANSFTFTLPIKAATRIVFMLSGQSSDHDMSQYNYQLELGSAATAYEPFDNTMYGGYVDLMTGEVVATHKCIDLNDVEFVYPSDGKRAAYAQFAQAYGIKAPITNNVYADVIAEKYKLILSGTQSEATNQWDYFISASGNLIIYTYGEQPTGKLVGALVTPITYQLTQQQITALLGTNNIYSNANSTTEVTYPFFQMGIESNVVEKRRHILLANTHHWVEASGNPVTFNTKMRYPLKQTRINFLPMQEGTGDPSPSNVRNIMGWTEIKGYNEPTCIPITYLQNNLYEDNNVKITAQGNDMIIQGTSTDSIMIRDIPIQSITFKPNVTYKLLILLSNERVGFDSLSNNGNSNFSWQFRTTADTSGGSISVKMAGELENYGDSPLTYSQQTTISKMHFHLYPNSGNAHLRIFFFESEATTYPLSWSSSGTIYGGYVNLETGEVWKTHTKVRLHNLDDMVNNDGWKIGYVQTSDSNAGLLGAMPPDSGIVDNGWMCNCVKTINTDSSDPGLMLYQAASSGFFYFRKISILFNINNTLADIKNYFDSNIIEVTYRLATPTLVTTLSPV